MKKGIFTISLDFELHWGVSEHRTVESYGENLQNTSKVIEQLLELFKEFGIHATWATVGMLFCEKREELASYVEVGDRPQYNNSKLSNYRLIPEVGKNYREDPFHFALPLIREIAKVKGQEIATHTFSHYYCLEKGQSNDNFRQDILAALAIAEKEQYKINSIVFPRNQYERTHLTLLEQLGLLTYRGNEQHWMYQPRSRANESALRRLTRLIDSYIKVSGDNTHEINFKDKLINVPSSRFLRPYNSKFAIFDGLRLNRICTEMSHAAKHNRLYHLWWHPHNFGKKLDKNILFLRKILTHFSNLNDKFGFQSKSMREVGLMKEGYA